MVDWKGTVDLSFENYLIEPWKERGKNLANVSISAFFKILNKNP